MFNPNNSSVYNAVKNFVKVLAKNNVSGFESMKVINIKRQPSNLRKLLT